LIETERRGHAKQIAQEMNLEEFDGIVCVSGDGLLSEVSSMLFDHFGFELF